MIMVLGALMAFLVPVSAQSNGEQWKSTSVMQTSGSNYTPQVTEVGAPMAASEATTTEGTAPAKAPGGPRKTNYDDLFDRGGDTGQSEGSPLGDAVLPLMLMAMAFSGVVYMRKRKAA